jgi:hypothetical protein
MNVDVAVSVVKRNFEFEVGEAPTGCRSNKVTNQHLRFTPVRQHNMDGVTQLLVIGHYPYKIPKY